MCGLFGVASRNVLSTAQEKFVRQATVTGSLRGIDSTGFAFVNNSNNIDVITTVQDGPSYMLYGSDKNFEATLGKAFIALGHNRAATMGKVVVANAHPFQYGNIVGAHNGTLLTELDLPVNTEDIDSKNIIASLAKIEEESNDEYPDYVKVLEVIDGAYALSWYDQTNQMLYFARNEERPLAITRNNNTIYWSSERGMLDWLMTRNKLTTANQSTEELPTYTLRGYDATTFELLVDRKYTSKVPDNGWWYGNSYRGGGSYGGRSSYNGGETLSGKYLEEAGWSGEYPVLVDSCEPSPTSGNSAERVNITGWVIKDNFKYPTTLFWVKSEAAEELRGKVLKAEVNSITYDDYTSEISKVTLKYTANTIVDCIVKKKRGKKLERFTKYVDSLTFEHGKVLEDEERRSNKPRLKLVHDGKKSESCHQDRTAGELLVPGPDGTFISVQEFDELVKHGCANCSVDLTADDAHDIVWTHFSAQPICPDCVPEIMPGTLDSNSEEKFNYETGEWEVPAGRVH